MAHQIETHGSEAAAIFARTDAWHRLGTTVRDRAFTAEEAMTLGHLGGWRVRKVPLIAHEVTADGVTTIDAPGYAIGGYLPILSPLKSTPALLRLFTRKLVDKWPSATRIANLVRVSKRVRLFILHAKDDYEIPWTQSEGLFAAAANATTDGGMDLELLQKMKARTTVDTGDGTFISTWKAGENKIIRQKVVAYGRESPYP